MLFYIDYETDRVPDWALDLASFIIIAGNTGFMIYCIVVFILAMQREAREAKGMTDAERRLYLRKMSEENSRSKRLSSST